MKEYNYNVEVLRHGFITIKANSEEEARNIASELATDEFEWSDSVEVDSCEER